MRLEVLSICPVAGRGHVQDLLLESLGITLLKSDLEPESMRI